MSSPNPSEKDWTAQAVAEAVELELRAALPSGWRLTPRHGFPAWTINVPPHDEAIQRTFDVYLTGGSILVVHGNSDPGPFGPTTFHHFIKRAKVLSVDLLDEKAWGGLAPRMRDCFEEIFRTERPNAWGYS
jgi:hypothetical protein